MLRRQSIQERLHAYNIHEKPKRMKTNNYSNDNVSIDIILRTSSCLVVRVSAKETGHKTCVDNKLDVWVRYRNEKTAHLGSYLSSNVKVHITHR